VCFYPIWRGIRGPFGCSGIVFLRNFRAALTTVIAYPSITYPPQHTQTQGKKDQKMPSGGAFSLDTTGIMWLL
jgi:hypothetical protein